MADLIDREFNYLKVIKFDSFRNNRPYWLCECKCGSQKAIRADKLTTGHTKSCGCIKYAQDRINLDQTTHGLRKIPEYHVWSTMIQRCSNIYNKNYGKRGIKVCERWLKFENFIADMGKRPNSKHSIERKDNNGNYCQENCVWATVNQQLNNKRTNVKWVIGETAKTLTEWAREFGLSPKLVWQRYKRGWSIRECLSQSCTNDPWKRKRQNSGENHVLDGA